MGKIGLQGIKVYGHIGVTEEERAIGRQFEIDIEVESPLRKAGISDHLEDTVNYETLLIIIHANMKKSFQLLEAAAKSMADEVKNFYPDITSICIKISKKRPFLKGEVGSSFIEWKND